MMTKTKTTTRIAKARKLAKEYMGAFVTCIFDGLEPMLPRPEYTYRDDDKSITFWLLPRGADVNDYINDQHREACYVLHVDFDRRKVWVPSTDTSIEF